MPLRDKDKEFLKEWSRMRARIDLGTFKGADPQKSLREVGGSAFEGSTDPLGPIRGPGNFFEDLKKDFSTVISKGATGSNSVDIGLTGDMERLEDIASKRKDIAKFFQAPEALDDIFQKLPDATNPNEYLGYIAETFDIGPADSRKKGAKLEHVVGEFNARRDRARQLAEKVDPNAIPSRQREEDAARLTGNPSSQRSTQSIAGGGVLSQAGQIAVPQIGEKPAEEEDKGKSIVGKILTPFKAVGEKLLTGLEKSAKAVPTGAAAAAEAGKTDNSFMDLGTIDDFLGGVAGTLSGKIKPEERKQWSEVLDPEKGYTTKLGDKVFDNKAVRAGVGFAADVSTDPITYLTFGAGTAAGGVKTAGVAGRKAAVETAGARAFAESFNSPATKLIAGTAALKASDDAALEAVQKLVPSLKGLEGVTAKKVVNKHVQEVGERTRYAVALEAKKAAEEKMAIATQKRLTAKFAGREIPGLQSTKAYNVLAEVGAKVAETRAAQGLNQAFRTSTYLPGETKNIANRYVNVGLSNWEETDKMIRNELLPDITAADGKLISHAIEEGNPLTGVIGENGADLATALEKSKAVLADMWDVENALGVYKTGPKENYVHHTYMGGTKKQQQAAKLALKAVGSEKPGFAKQQLITSLKDAKLAELKPVEDIKDILSIRAGKSHNVRARAMFAKEVANEYGVKVTAKQAKEMGLEKHGSDFIEPNVYFPKEIVGALKGIEELHSNPQVLNEYSKLLDKVNNTWKLTVTATPGFHLRNLQGDTFLNFQAGVKSPAPYAKAINILTSKAGKQQKYRVGKKQFTGAELWNEFQQSGGMSSFGVAELPNRATSHFLPPAAVAPIRKLSETRENFTRFSHFIDKVGKYGSDVKNYDDLRRASIEAANDVQKWNMNYMDLTPTERKLKRYIPFYTFARKNIPLQIESAFLQPGKIATKQKSFNALEVLLGTDDMDSPEVELGADIPNWAKEAAMEAHESGEAVRTGPGSHYNPRLPTETLSEPLKILQGEKGGTGDGPNLFTWGMSQVAPTARIPFELGTGKQMFGNRKIHDQAKYLKDQQPSIIDSLIQNIDPNLPIEERKRILTKLLASTFNAERYKETATNGPKLNPR